MDGLWGPAEHSTLFIVDTAGELKDFTPQPVRSAGGGLKGYPVGHNPIEPAIPGKPMIVSSLMSSFNDAMNKFLRPNANIQLAGAYALDDRLVYLFKNPDIG